jgi:hypothetical protein
MRSDSLKLPFGLAAAAWILLWLFSAGAAGGVLGDSRLQLLFFLGMAFLPPICFYLLLFEALPRIVGRFRRKATQD